LHRGRSSPAGAGSDRVPDSLRRAHPTKASSSPVAVPHHCGRSPPVVPGSRDRSCAILRLAEARSTRWHSVPDLPPLRLPIRSRRSPARPPRRAPKSSPWPADSRVWHHRRVRGTCCRCRQQTLVPSMGFLPLRDLPRAVGVRALARIRSRVPSGCRDPRIPTAYRPASVRRSVRNLAAAGLPGVSYVKERLDLGVGLARKFD
jgi:hypothetical protein